MPSILSGKTLRISIGHQNETSTSDSKPKVAIRPGTVLYGEILYKPPYPEDVTSLTVNLLGKLVVKADKGRREVTQLFSVQLPIISRDGDDVPVGRKENRFEFHFVVPYITEYDRTGTYRPDLQDVFAERPHRVPPTLGPRSKNDAQVLYSVSAVLRKKGQSAHNLIVLNDLPVGTELENIECIVEHIGVTHGAPQVVRRELAPPAPRTGIFRRNSVTSEVVPSDQRCTVSIEGSSLFVLGEPYNITASVNFGDSEGAQQSARHWTFAIKGVCLISRVHRRFKRDGTVFTDEETFPVKWADKPVVIEPGGSPTSCEIVLGKMDSVVPSFKSYTIARSYTLRINVISSVETGRSNVQELQQMDLPVEVIQRSENLVGRSSALQDINGRAIDPPAYEDSPAYH